MRRMRFTCLFGWLLLPLNEERLPQGFCPVYKQSRESLTGEPARFPYTPHSTTNPLTAAALIYAIGAGITAGAGTRLVLQLLLVGGFTYHPLQSPHSERRSRYFSSLPHQFGIGQFTRLLPSVEVVAISQAPSPESNPNSPYPLSPR